MDESQSPSRRDAAWAAERVRQLQALADPMRLQLLSLLATHPDGSRSAGELGAALGLDAEVAAAHLEALRSADLVQRRPSTGDPRFAPTPDAWIRFGRMLGVRPPYREPSGRTQPTLPIQQLPQPIQRVAERLAYRYSAHFSRETVDRYVAESYLLLKERASVIQHLPSLTNRFATDRLGALAEAQGLVLHETPELLFVCVQNSGRSQMAAGIARMLAGDRVHVRTAGSQPVRSIDAAVADALDEIGVPIVAEFPKPLTDEVVQAADVVVTMGCGDACPVYPGRLYLDWPVADPSGLQMDGIRSVRDEIQGRVEGLLAELGIAF